MWVRFISYELRASFAFSTASHAFLSVIVVPFDRALHWDSFDTLGWAWGLRMASELSFLLDMVRGEHGFVVLFVAFRVASDYLFHYHRMKKLCNQYRIKI